MVGIMRSDALPAARRRRVLFLIACANVANLLLARATRSDARDRAALGARRRPLAHRPPARRREPAARAPSAARSGSCSRTWAPARLIRARAVRSAHGSTKWRLTVAVLAFAALASVVASLIFGLVPAWHASRVDLRERADRGRTRGHGRRRVQHACAPAWRSPRLDSPSSSPSAAAFCSAASWRSRPSTLGYRTSDVLVVQANLPVDRRRGGSGRVSWTRLERLLPAIAHACRACARCRGDRRTADGHARLERLVRRRGQAHVRPGAEAAVRELPPGEPGYFDDHRRSPLRRGRDFTAQDRYDCAVRRRSSAEALVREIFPNEDPIGHRIQCGLDSMNYMTIVGVVGDIRDEPGTPPAHELYMPLAQHPGRGSAAGDRRPHERRAGNAHRHGSRRESSVPIRKWRRS